MTSGKIWRMGENFWTSLDLAFELTEERLVIALGSFALSAPVSVSHR